MTKLQLKIVLKYLGWFVIYMALFFFCLKVYRKTEDFFILTLGGVCFLAAWANFIFGAVRAQMMLNNDDETSEG